MNYRIYCWRKPVKRVQLLPTDLSSKYPDSLQPSFLLVWCWKILLATETAGLALARWWRRHVQIGHQVINDRSQGLAIQARTRRYRELYNGWLSWAFRSRSAKSCHFRTLRSADEVEQDPRCPLSASYAAGDCPTVLMEPSGVATRSVLDRSTLSAPVVATGTRPQSRIERRTCSTNRRNPGR